MPPKTNVPETKTATVAKTTPPAKGTTSTTSKPVVKSTSAATPVATPAAATPAAKKATVAKKEPAAAAAVVAPVEEAPASTTDADETTSPDEAVVTETTEEPAAQEGGKSELDTHYDEHLKHIEEQIQALETMRKDLTLQIQVMRKIQKSSQVMVKKLSKKGNKSKKNPNKKPSGINAPHKVGDIGKNLVEFMKTRVGSNTVEFSRIDALKEVNKYIKENNLQNKEMNHKQEVLMDDTLKKIFPELVAQGTPLKYTGIMGSLGQHFPKKDD
jgi:chromatin remodeling complex protein RSC6